VVDDLHSRCLYRNNVCTGTPFLTAPRLGYCQRVLSDAASCSSPQRCDSKRAEACQSPVSPLRADGSRGGLVPAISNPQMSLQQVATRDTILPTILFA